ncbi:MAG: fibronectin type III domain-containing protein [Lachnospiraceae bacterium]|nr:fibronectin type III domain-containing protein [Lachnospiraceae bacterium]MDE6251304.1 fibronectin type III domain-containing protein [Lachnospiraceae bacterium]
MCGEKVTWKKDTKGAGYELQYSTTKNFVKKSTITVNISKNKTTSYKVRKLAKGKKYYIRIRTYQNVKVNGKAKKLYGDWSAVKQSGKVRKK